MLLPTKYLDVDALKLVGIWEEVDMYLKNIGWDKWAELRYPSYETITFEFFSSYAYDDENGKISFRLGNESFSFSVDDLNDFLHLPRFEDDVGGFDKHAFWSQISGLNEQYNPTDHYQTLPVIISSKLTF